MSFYGNIREDMTKAQFQFDRIYANRTAMDSAVEVDKNTTTGITYKTDGVFVGRFVLVDYNIPYDEENPAFATGYDPEPVEGRQGYYTIRKIQNGEFFTVEEVEALDDGNEQIVVVIGTDLVEYFAYYKQQRTIRQTESGEALFSKIGEEYVEASGSQISENESTLVIVNSKVDKDKYGATYNGTVWQKVIYHNKEQYILVAKLNSDKPDIEGRLIAPSDSPSIQEADANSYIFYYPSPWKVSGEVNFGNDQIDKYLGTKEHDFHQKTPTNTVEITKTIGADNAYYDAETGARVIGEKEDTLNFVFSIGEFKDALANFWDMIYGPGTNDQTHKLEPAIDENGNLTNENPRLLDTTFYPNKTLDALKLIKTFDPTTAAGIINLLQLYLGRGSIPVNQKVPSASEIPTSQARLQECYENNYVLPSIEIDENGVNWENEGQPVPDFSDLYYVKKLTVFTPIKDNTEDFSLVDGQLVIRNSDSVYTKDSEGNVRISTMANGSPCTEDDFNSLYYISGYTYTTEKLAEEDGIISLLAELMKLLGSGDKESRDPSTIQGLFNTLEDQIIKVQQDMRNAIVWNRDEPIDKAVLQAVYGDPIENQYYNLDNVITELGNKFWSAENGHLIKNIETKDGGNEMSARLVFGKREATAYDSIESEIKTNEPQGIVYHGSKYKTSAIRFLDNEMTAGRSQLGKNDVASDGQYYRYENGEYSKIDYFTFDVDFLEDTNDDGVIDYNDVGTVENSSQEVEYDTKYDYYELALNEEVYINNDANNEGNGLSIGAGGLTILGAGEGPWLYEKYIVDKPFAGEKMIRPNTEYLEILSDEKTNFYAGLNEYKEEWENYGSHAVLDALEEYWNLYNQTVDAQELLTGWKEKIANYVEAYEQYASDYGYLYTRDVNFNKFQIESQKDINKIIPQKDENDVQVYINPKQEEHGTKTYRYSDLFLANVTTEQNLEQDAATIYYERIFLKSYASAVDAVNAEDLAVGDIYYTKTSTTYVEHTYNGEATGLIYVKDSSAGDIFIFARIGGLDIIPATAEIEDEKYVNYFYWRAPTFEYYTYNENTWERTSVATGTYLDGLKEPSLFRYLSSTYNDNNGLYFRKATTEDLTSKNILFTKLVNDVYKPVSNLSINKVFLKMNDYTGEKKSLLDVGYRVVTSEIVKNNFESPEDYYVLNEEINLKEVLTEYMEENADTTKIKVYDGVSFGVTTNEETNNDLFIINMGGQYGSSFADYFSENTLTVENFEKNIWIVPTAADPNIYQVARTAPTTSMTAWKALLTDLRPHIEDYRVATIEKNTLSLKNSLTLEKQPGQEQDLILTNDNQYLSLGGNLVYDNRRITYGTNEPTSTDALEGDIYIQLIS